MAKIKNTGEVIVMLSGGLDSRLVVKILQEQGFKIIALFFKLPFGSGCCDEKCSFNFSQLQGIKLVVFDCTKGKLLQEYLDIIRKPRYGYGTAINPCIDCRIFMLKKAKEFADKYKIKIIATGEVEGERLMSQTRKAMEIIEKESGLKERLIRPLCDIGIKGRSRKRQIELAKKYRISYPHPAGGCLLCEKDLKNRIKVLLKRRLNEEQVKLIPIGRHFIVDRKWVILGRNEKENEVLEKLKNKKKYKVIIPKMPGPSAMVVGRINETIKNKINKMIKAHSKRGSLKDRKKFDKWRL